MKKCGTINHQLIVQAEPPSVSVADEADDAPKAPAAALVLPDPVLVESSLAHLSGNLLQKALAGDTGFPMSQAVPPGLLMTFETPVKPELSELPESPVFTSSGSHPNRSQ